MQEYYNTNNLRNQQLLDAIDKNANQEVIIECIFKYENRALTASQVWGLFPNKTVPLTSIRRALTNLCSKNAMFKLDKMIIGLYGKPEHFYSLKQD
jgi:hypothetical protein